MEHNRLHTEVSDAHETPQLTVAFLGFETKDEENFIRFFQTDRPNQRKYVAATRNNHLASHILMVNYDNPTALKNRDAILVNKPNIPVVAVSRGPLPEPPLHHIRGLLFAARVLTTLDKVEVGSLDAKPARNPSPETPIQRRILEPRQPKQLPVKPAAPSQDAPKTSAVAAAVASPSTNTTTQAKDGYRALVVDDSVAIQKSLEINLSTLPQITKIDFADSGENALEKAEASPYDLIFLDVMMPGIDGYETCTRLRKNPAYKKTPIIMVSGKTSPLDEVKGVMAGCTTYLTKPVQKEAFQKLSIRILAWLEKQK